MNDYTLFVKEVNEYLTKSESANKTEPKMLFSELCKKVLNLECIDYRLHYLKAYYYNSQNNIKKALEEIDICLASLGVLTDSSTYNHFPIKGLNVDPREVYYLAGETFAKAGDYNRSLDAFKKHQLASILKSVNETYLYSFRNFNEHSLSDLINQEITVSPPSEFNDPFDTLLMQWTDCLKGRNKNAHIKPYIDSFDYYRIRSFTKDTTSQRAYRNIQMWSHYAYNHEGFCIKYRFWPDFTNNTDIHITFRSVNYAKRKEKIDVTESSINLNPAFCLKEKKWNYEHEVRLIAFMPETKSQFDAIPMGDYCNIDSIYFGIRCKDTTVMTIQKLLRKYGLNVKYYKMKSNPNDIYNLIAIPC